MPPTKPAVLHYYDGPCDIAGKAMFVCLIGHRFRCDIRTANSRADRDGGGWIIGSCPICLPTFHIGAATGRSGAALLQFLRDNPLSPPTATPRSIYIGPVAAAAEPVH
jgi:hypothetical protein